VISNAAAVLGATPDQTLYPIDAGQRGTRIYHSFNTTLFPISGGTNLPYFIMQTTLPNNTYNTTTRFILNGIVPYVQSITSTTYNTLLIVSYLPPPNSGQQSIMQYVVVPSDEIVTLNYFPQNYGPVPNIETPFNSTAAPGTLPFFSVDPAQRASDIVQAINMLMNNAPFKNTETNSQVWVQTTLTGPYNPPLPEPGLLKYIQADTYTNGLIQITFQTSPQQTAQTILVAPEQVQRIIYLRQYAIP
jgi:hypothetical protein